MSEPTDEAFRSLAPTPILPFVPLRVIDDSDDALYRAAARRAEDAIAELLGVPEDVVGGPGPYHYASAVVGATTVDAPTVGEILATMTTFTEARDRTDDGMAAAIAVTAWRNRMPLDALAARLGVWFADLLDILRGTLRPIPARFWDKIRWFAAAYR
jgi:hypothetical protein